MGQIKFLLGSIVLLVLSYICLFFVAVDVPENFSDLNDTNGVPAVAVYVALLLVIYFFAVLLTCLGAVVSIKISRCSFKVRMAAFIVFNFMLVLASLFTVLVISAYVFGTWLGYVGITLDLAAIALVVASAPRRSKIH